MDSEVSSNGDDYQPEPSPGHAEGVQVSIVPGAGREKDQERHTTYWEVFVMGKFPFGKFGGKGKDMQKPKDMGGKKK